MKRQISLLILIAVLLNGCALWPRTGKDFVSRRHNAKQYRKAADAYGWVSPGDVDIKYSDINTPAVITHPCQIGSAWRVTRRYSHNHALRWLQKRKLAPTRTEQELVFFSVGTCISR